MVAYKNNATEITKKQIPKTSKDFFESVDFILNFLNKNDCIFKILPGNNIEISQATKKIIDRIIFLSIVFIYFFLIFTCISFSLVV